MERSLAVIQLIYRLMKALITGEPFYILLMLPRREEMYVDLKDVSIPIIDNGFHASLKWVEDNDLALVRLTEEEEAMIARNEKKN